MQQTGAERGVGPRWKTRPRGRGAAARGATQKKGQEGAREKARWFRREEGRDGCRCWYLGHVGFFLCGTRVRPNYRTQAARSEATANQETCSPVGWVARFVRVLIIRRAVSLQQRLTFCPSSNNYIRQIYGCVISPCFPNAHVRPPRGYILLAALQSRKTANRRQRQKLPTSRTRPSEAGSTTPRAGHQSVT